MSNLLKRIEEIVTAGKTPEIETKELRKEIQDKLGNDYVVNFHSIGEREDKYAIVTDGLTSTEYAWFRYIRNDYKNKQIEFNCLENGHLHCAYIHPEQLEEKLAQAIAAGILKRTS